MTTTIFDVRWDGACDGGGSFEDLQAKIGDDGDPAAGGAGFSEVKCCLQPLLQCT